MLSRLALLFTLSWIMGLTADLFSVMGMGISGRDLVLLFGGLFLLYKASHEIFVEVEAREQDVPPQTDPAAMKAAGTKLFWAIIGQIAIIDIVFSLDSVITAVGMVEQIGVMVAAIICAVAVMMLAAKPIGEFVDRADAALSAAYPGIRIVAFGHVGDGNLHYNQSKPEAGENAVFIAAQGEVNRIVHDIVHELGGSISAEHGIGQLKREELLRYKSPVEMDMMRAVKRALDPTGIMNPGKVI